MKTFKTILKNPTENISIQIFRYGIGGAAAFTVDVTCLYILTEYFAVNYLISAAIGFGVGTCVSYVSDAFWVFNAHTLRSRKMEMIIFVLLAFVGMGLNELSIWLVTEYAGAHYMVSKMAATIVVYCWNFFSRKYILFTPNPIIKFGVNPELLNQEKLS